MVVPKCTTRVPFSRRLAGIQDCVRRRLARSRDEGILLLSGTAFYWATEDWSLIQSLYFSVVTLTTVG